MTSIEMDDEFLILYDKITSFDAPGYTPEERSIFLTKGQERVFLDYYNPLGNKYKEGFEETEGRRKDLNELVRTANPLVSASQTGTMPNGVFYDLPTDCLYAISEEVTTASNDVCNNNKRIRVKPIMHDEYSINIKNPFKKPSPDLVWRMDVNNKRHELITDGTYTVGTYHLRYLKRPRPIITDVGVTLEGITGLSDCELNPILHRRIIDEAVKIATGVTDPSNYQIKTIEKQAGE